MNNIHKKISVLLGLLATLSIKAMDQCNLDIPQQANLDTAQVMEVDRKYKPTKASSINEQEQPANKSDMQIETIALKPSHLEHLSIHERAKIVSEFLTQVLVNLYLAR